MQEEKYLFWVTVELVTKDYIIGRLINVLANKKDYDFGDFVQFQKFNIIEHQTMESHEVNQVEKMKRFENFLSKKYPKFVNCWTSLSNETISPVIKEFEFLEKSTF